jgi:uncharacterized protein with PIN domain
MIRAFLDWWRNIERCPDCQTPLRIVTRNMGGIVPYEWIECDGCKKAGWGARL